MSTAAIVEALTNMNGLEAIGLFIVYLISTGIGKKLWIRYKTKKENPHKNCPFYPDFKLTIRKSVDMATKIFRIENYDTIRRQMAKVEGALFDIVDAHNINYVALVRSINDGTVTGYEADIHHYAMTMEKVVMAMKLKIRDRILQNHIKGKGSEAFKAYRDHANRNLVSIVIALLDKEYDSRQFKIGRADLHDYNTTKLGDEIYPILNNMWDAIKSIAMDAEAEIKIIEEED